MIDVRALSGALATLDGKRANVYPNRCVRVRNRNASCRACADACAAAAIVFDDDAVHIDAARCLGCGSCATVCPACVFEPLVPSDDDLAAACRAALKANENRLVLVCTEEAEAAFGNYDHAKVVEVRCLGRVDESLLASAAASGCEAVTLVGHACEKCACRTGRVVAEAVCACASSVLEAWGSPLELTFAAELPSEVRVSAFCAEGLSDRPMPSAASAPDEWAVAGDDRDDVQPALPHVGRDGTLPHHMPTRRGRLLSSLAQLGCPAETTVETRLWATLSVDAQACGSCRLCAVFCPTGALAKLDDRKTGAFCLTHTPSLCVQCRCCEDVCRRGALRLSDAVFAPDIADGHTERIDLEPPAVALGRPTTVVNKMRTMLGSPQVNFA